jgi:hypothetical protein
MWPRVPDDGEVAMPETRWAGLAWALWLLALLGLAATAWLDRLLAWPGTLPAESWPGPATASTSCTSPAPASCCC